MKYGKLFVWTAAACLAAVLLYTSARADEAPVADVEVPAAATAPAQAPPPPVAEAKKPVYRGLYGGAGIGMADYDHGGTEAAWRLDVWVRAFNYGSIQFGYVNLGDPGSGDTDGVTYAAVPQLPLGDYLTLHAKVGGLTDTHNNKTETELVLGTGVSVSLPYDLGVRAEYEHYDFNNNVEAVFLSLYYKFATF